MVVKLHGTGKLLLLGVLFACAGIPESLTAGSYARGRVQVDFTGSTGLRELQLTNNQPVLESMELLQVDKAGAPCKRILQDVAVPEQHITFSCFGNNGLLQLVVSSATPMVPETLFIELTQGLDSYTGKKKPVLCQRLVAVGPEPKVLVRGIADGFTGTGADDGVHIRYLLKGNPGPAAAAVTVQYALVPESNNAIVDR